MDVRYLGRMMKTKDYLVGALAPLPVLLIPLVGMRISAEWKWTSHDFLFAWIVLAVAILVFRLLATRRFANFAYKAGAGLAVLTGFLISWVTAAVGIIGDENPANALYLGVVLTGLVGIGLARFQPAGMAKAAFVTAAVTFVVPIVAFIFWPVDFSPGVLPVFFLNGCFVLMFVVAGLLFRQAAGRFAKSGEAQSA